MDFARQTNQALDAEHAGTLELMGRVERALARPPASGAAPDPAFRKLMASLAHHLEQEVPAHFGFEERDLFPLLDDAGEGELAALLAEEHVTIVAVVDELLPLALRAAQGGLDAGGHAALRRAALELAGLLAGHIDKETKALLPALDQILDEETDRTLAFAHAAG